MTELRIGIVCEGKTNFIVFEHLLLEALQKRNPSCNLRFVNLQPSSDSTSGSAEGGWEMVYKWCIQNPPEVRLEKYFGSGLFADDLSGRSCDVILVQVDTDICELVGHRCSVKFPTSVTTPMERGSYIKCVLHEWLWPDHTLHDNRHFEAPAVQEIEAWLVAGLEARSDAESLTNASLELLHVEHRRRGVPSPSGARAIRKTPARYKRLSRAAVDGIENIYATCTWFQKLVIELSSYIDQLSASALTPVEASTEV